MEQVTPLAWPDYAAFAAMLAISAAVGVYWGFVRGQPTRADYLLGNRNMQVLPVAMSLVASFVSGITLLGSPTEVYLYGTQYAYILGAVWLSALLLTQVYLPVLHQLKLTSNYEYLSLRFDNRVRMFGSLLFAFNLIGWLPIVIYVPALAFNQMTGVNVHVITPIVCLVCVFYTSAGGLQAVVWTDVIQITAMVGAMALVAVKGTLDVGGAAVVWQRNMDSGRIEPPDWDLDPRTRHTIWNLVLGGTMYWLQASAVNQTMVQRYLALPTLRAAKWAVVLFCIGISVLYCFCLYCGLLIYAKYHDCDPLQTQVARAKDQLLPLLVSEALSGAGGARGVFVAGVFSAALSSLSTSLNSMSAVVVEDWCGGRLSERAAARTMRAVVVLLGALCVGLVFAVERLGTVLQLTMTLESITMGPQLGVFSMGLLMPWVDATSALAGGAAGLAVMAWWGGSAQLALARGQLAPPHKPLSVRGCGSNYTLAASTAAPAAAGGVAAVSYMWYTAAGAAAAMAAGGALAALRRRGGGAWVPPPPALLAPQLRRLYKEPPHPADDSYIRAYGNKDTGHIDNLAIDLKLIDE